MFGKIRYILSGVFCTFLFWPVLAQELSFKQIGIEQGLPSTEVHDVYQDRKGYIWFATDHGLCRFDGLNYYVISTNEGLTDNTVFDILEDEAGNLWVSTYSGGICIIVDGKAYPHPANSILCEYLGEYYTNDFTVGPDSSIVFTQRLSSRFKETLCTLKVDGEIICEAYDPVEILLRIHENYNQNVGFVHQELKRSIGSKKLFLKQGHDYWFSPSGKIFLSIFNNLLYFNPVSNEVDTLAQNTDVVSLWEDAAGVLWAGTKYTEGLFRYEFDAEGHYTKEQILEGVTVTDVVQDAEQNYWISTIEEGVFFLPNPEIRIYGGHESLSGKVLALATFQDRLWVSTYHGPTLSFNPTKAKPDWRMEMEGLASFDLESRDDVIFSSNRFYQVGSSLYFYEFLNLNVKTVAVSPQKDLYMGGILGLIKLTRKGGEIIESTKYSDDLSIFSLCFDEEQTLWAGTLNGLGKIENDSLIFDYNDNPYLKIRVTEIQPFQQDGIVFATKGEGLVFYLPDTILNVSTAAGLNSQFIKSIFVQNDSTVWAGGNLGLNRINLTNTPTPEIKSVESFGRKDGILSNEVFDIEWMNDRLWLATGKGLCSLSPSKLIQEPKQSFLQITDILVNNKPKSQVEGLLLDPQENDLTFKYIGIRFKDPQEVRYRYKLTGYDEDWQETNQRSISYTNLPSGNYLFRMYASTDGRNWWPSAQAIPFAIRKAYYEKLWFWLLTSLLGVALLYFVYSRLSRRQMAKASLERKVIRSEQKALRAQINPHFIYNAMNSIQFFISENDKHNAGIYLSRFSKLMRKILDNSKKNWITLEEELESIRYYLDLEQLRFEEKFDYLIFVPENIDPYETEIPSMVLQPILENAIWHGLMQKPGKGLVKISFQKKDELLSCTIEDNGIGRSASRKFKRPGHKSSGMENLNERIKLVNAFYRTQMKMEVKDLYDQTDRPIGTQVMINFPLIQLGVRN